MPTKPVKKFTAWSYSRLGDYTACPLRAKLKHLDRIPEPSAPALERGAVIHEAAAKYVSGTTKTLPKDLKLFKKEFAALRKASKGAAGRVYLVEEQWAFNDKWNPCGWFGDGSWCRMVLDLGYKDGGTLRIIDYKTGRVRAEEQRPQLALYALGGLAKFPDVEKVVAEFWYLDHGEIIQEEYVAAELKELKKAWGVKVKPMLKDKTFAPRPSDKCRWCHYSKAKMGHCKF